VIDLAQARGLEVVEDFITRFDVYTADEMFLTGTAAEVIPVVEVDSRTIGEGNVGEMTKILLEDFHEMTRSDGPEIPLG
jgi:branched-chain amino acid aminotransferase